MKLWSEQTSLDKQIENFTIGQDRILDLYLAPYDVLGNIAHAIMLESVGLLSFKELESLQRELKALYEQTIQGSFTIEDGVEDIHSQVEKSLIDKLGDIGRKIHTARSRNDQILVDLKLFARHELMEIVTRVDTLINAFLAQSDAHADKGLPGYTHLQMGMPSSFGLWFGAYAESLTDDLRGLKMAYEVVNKNPLGSAAGYGSSFPIDRALTTKLLGFDELSYNSVYAQMERGKTESVVSGALAQLAQTVAKFATDVCLYNSENFGFIALPDSYTTGSSIMPHKKNPDVFELLRGRSNMVIHTQQKLMGMSYNLPSGYFRDYQLLKEEYIPLFDKMKEILDMAIKTVPHVTPKADILEDGKYENLFTVEEINKQVAQGIPFRVAYGNIKKAITENNFQRGKELTHTHMGSMGNLCNDKILERKERLVSSFNFQKSMEAISSLVGGSFGE